MDEREQKGKSGIRELKPYLSPLSVWALSFGCAVGWGSFVMPGNVFLPLAGPIGTALGMFIGAGLLVLLGVGHDDTAQTAERMWRKISRLRIFCDDAGKTNLSLADVHGEVLVVSQFTLYADCRKGNRPSFTDAAQPSTASELYELFCSLVEGDLGHVGHGVFGADMQVSLVNDGPFTVWLEI